MTSTAHEWMISLGVVGVPRCRKAGSLTRGCTERNQRERLVTVQAGSRAVSRSVQQATSAASSSIPLLFAPVASVWPSCDVVDADFHPECGSVKG
jgi:hypothetical protein